MQLRALELEKPKVMARGDHFVATLDEIGLICPGNTEADALDSLWKTAFSLLRNLAQKGLLSDRMQYRGIRIVYMETPEVLKANHQIIPVLEEL